MAEAKINIRIQADSAEAVSNIQGLMEELKKAAKQAKDTGKESFGSELPKQTKKGVEDSTKELEKLATNAKKVLGGMFAFEALKHSIQSIAELSDKFTSIKARINLMNDGLRTNEQLLKQIHDAANDARGGYIQMAASVSKLGILAGSAFKNNDEIVGFVSQLNKQFALSGASIEEASAAMYQLTQAMASGKLQGDEFHSILENAPMLAKAIAEEMHVPFGELKNLSAQGLITADVIKNALMNSADETNAKFADMPMTFGQAMTIIQNDAMQAFQGVLEQIASITSGENFKALAGAMRAIFTGVASTVSVAIGVIKVALIGVKQVCLAVVQVASNMFKIFTAGYQVIIPLLAGYIAYKKQDVILSALQATKTMLVTVAEKSWNATKLAGIAIMKGYQAVAKAVLAVTIGYKAALAGARGASIAFRSATLLGAGAMAIFNAVILANPIPILIAALAALAAAFVGPKIAAQGLGETMHQIWNSIVHTTAWAINVIVRQVNKLIDVLNAVSGKINKVFKVDLGKIDHFGEIDAQSAENFANQTEGVAKSVFNPDTGGGTVSDTGGAGGGAGGSGGGHAGAVDKLKELKDAAKQAHEDIADQWKQLFATKEQLVDDWFTKEKAKLDESKSVNANYTEDLARLNEVYEDKKQKAYQEDIDLMQKVKRQAYDMGEELRKALDVSISQDHMSPLKKLNEDTKKAVQDIKRHYEDLASSYASMSRREQDAFKAQLDANKIAYEVDANNRISFETLASERIQAIYRDAEAKKLDIATQGAEERYAIEEAMRQGNFEALKTALDSETALRLEQIDQHKSMMEEYAEAVKDSVFSVQDSLYQSLSQGLGDMEKSISDMLMGTKTLAQAFQSLGKIIMQTISNYVAHYIASKLKASLLDKQLSKQQLMEQQQQAAAQTTAWTNPAIMRAIAEVGPLAAPGAVAAALGAGQGMSAGFSLGSMALGGMNLGGVKGWGCNLPRYASGGIAYDTTIGMIGEGQYPEAVLPLSEDTYSKLGEGINNAGGGQPIVINVSALDVDGFDSYLRGKGGAVLRKFTQSQHDEFKLEGAY